MRGTRLVDTPCTVFLRSRDRVDRDVTRPTRCAVPVDTWRIARGPLIPVSGFSPPRITGRSVVFTRATLLHFLPVNTRYLIEIGELQALLVPSAPMFDGSGNGRYSLGRVAMSLSNRPVSQLSVRLLDGESCLESVEEREWAMWLRLE